MRVEKMQEKYSSRYYPDPIIIACLPARQGYWMFFVGTFNNQ
jgi:hypothetical protein